MGMEYSNCQKFSNFKDPEEFSHERPTSCDDRKQSRKSRGWRPLIQGVNTNFDQSGAPSNFLGHTSDNCVHQPDMLPWIMSVDKYDAKATPNRISLLEKSKSNFWSLACSDFWKTSHMMHPNSEKRILKNSSTTEMIRWDCGVMQAYVVWNINARKYRGKSLSWHHTLGFWYLYQGMYSKKKKATLLNIVIVAEDMQTPPQFKSLVYKKTTRSWRKWFSNEEFKKCTES